MVLSLHYSGLYVPCSSQHWLSLGCLAFIFRKEHRKSPGMNVVCSLRNKEDIEAMAAFKSSFHCSDSFKTYKI